MTREGEVTYGYFPERETEKATLAPTAFWSSAMNLLIKSSEDYMNTALIYTNLRLLYISDFLFSVSYNKKL